MTDLKPLNLKRSPKKGFKRLLSKYWPVFFFVALVLAAVSWWNNGSSNPSVFSFVLGPSSVLKTENDRVNILLLGIAGGNHDGPNLTDTIMVASYNVKSHTADLISLPRDLWLDEHKAKVNTLYQIGLNRGDGLGFAKKEIGDILGITIPYAVRVDFDGFIKAVDLVEGLDVTVARSFDDYAYPIPGKEDELCGYKEGEQDISEEQSKSLGVGPGKVKVLLDPGDKIATAAASPGINLSYTDDQVLKFFPCRFEHLSFKQGPTHLDGEMALKFVRSRHGTNGEGSDFARSKRQQLVLQAFRSKVLSLGTLGDLSKVTSLVKTFGASIDTDIPAAAYPEFIKLAKQSENTKNFVIDTGGGNPLLITPPVGDYGAWVLVPPNNDFSKIQQYVKNILSGELDASGSAQQK